ncbi:MAG: hypothetical protein MSC30_17015 [Gaiellaceae bacterium MAG52_C11]|nr:hypothetical protein [Candidatus Gaiellasilicea maunaloa]
MLLDTPNPEQAKELLRLLVKEIRVHDRHRIVPTYRVPAAVRTMPTTMGRNEHYANRFESELTAPLLAL